MRGKNKKYSLQRLIVLIIIGTMCVLLFMQTIALAYFGYHNDKKNQEYIKGMVSTIDASLMSIGQSIEGLGSYIGSYGAFQELYIDKLRSSDSYVEAYETVRFMATYMPIIMDVVVVDINNIPVSYYSAIDYSVIDLVKSDYSFTDTAATEKKFLFWEDKEYFVYMVPIQDIYSSYDVKDKKATAVLICDFSYVKDLIKMENDVVIELYDLNDRTIASNYTEGDIGADKPIFAELESSPLGLTIRALSNTSNEEVYLLLRWFFLISVIVIIVCMLVGLILLNRHIARPIISLADDIVKTDNRNLKSRVPNIAITEINQIVDSFNLMLDENTDITRRIFNTQDKLYETELQKNQAELNALQSQINPHFLYNTLQCIRSIAILEGSDEIAEITLAMAELFRYSIQPGDTVVFSQELEIVKKYELINNIRFRNRFNFIYDIDDEIYSSYIIKMIIQPIIENAIIHGVSKLEEGGTIIVKGWKEKDTVYISVSDDGPDLNKEYVDLINEQLSYEYRAKNKVECLGLYNINRRLILRYGDSYGLNLKREGNITTVTISFPFLLEESD